ncbi:hypothetical protein [Photobacterium ganghwense]|uniref:hypothetical protein n=1 Tax=Photobacterium ganghwense TaxID=320778 RepID=UPI000A4C2E78|nr:hypothetical protein [Photobacterium ganghwense]
MQIHFFAVWLEGEQSEKSCTLGFVLDQPAFEIEHQRRVFEDELTVAVRLRLGE